MLADWLLLVLFGLLKNVLPPPVLPLRAFSSDSRGLISRSSLRFASSRQSQVRVSSYPLTFGKLLTSLEWIALHLGQALHG